MTTKKTTLVEFEMTAVIPVAQYSNVQPVIKGYGATYEEARDDANEKLAVLWSMYAENKDALKLANPNTPATAAVTETMKCYLSGTAVEFDPVAHSYFYEGEKLMSGSAYASQFEHEFDANLIAPRCEKKLQTDAETIKDYWNSKADCSTTLGTALHQAMEHYQKYYSIFPLDTDSKTGELKGTGIHPLLLPHVQEYWEGKDPANYVAEPFVVDVKNGRCGQIDLLEITGNKKCIIRDYKSNGDLEKLGQPAYLKAPYTNLSNTPLNKYSLQLSFYKAIVESHGWEVEGLFIDWFNGETFEWEEISIPFRDIDKPQAKIDISQVV